MKIVAKDKRGGLMQNGDVLKTIDEILNLKKPRSIFSLIKMLYTVSKNFAFSLNAIMIGALIMAVYHYLIKRKLFCLVTFRLLDRVA